MTNFLNFARPADLTLSRVDLRAICERAAEEVRGDIVAAGGGVEWERVERGYGERCDGLLDGDQWSKSP